MQPHSLKPLGIGLIGAGKHGLRYVEHMAEDIPQAELVAVCRRNRSAGEQLAARYGCHYHATYDQLIADQNIDAIAIVVPPALHGSIVAAACRAGKHILIEKPLAVSVAEAQQISAIIDASPIRCMVAQTLRFNSVVQTLKQHLSAIAPLHSLHLSQHLEPSSLAWIDRKAESGGGIILHTGVHSFDLLYFLSGQATTQVWCQTKTIFTRETEDNFQMYGRTTDPLLTVQVSGSRSTQSRSGLIEITGENGQLVGDHAHNFVDLVRGRERIPVSVPPPVPTVKEAVQAFVDALQNNTPFPVTVEDGLRAVAIAEACYRSAETGQIANVIQ